MINTVLSIILPVYNGDREISNAVASLIHAPCLLGISFEIILVNDGSTDSTASVLSCMEDPRISVITLGSNRGKYAALRAGIASARGTYTIFTDIDLPFDLEALPHIVSILKSGSVPIVVGDRTLPNSSYFDSLPYVRRYASVVFSTFVRLFVAGGLFDTQCGLKGFRTSIAQEICKHCVLNRFGGDVELLYLALKLNIVVKRIPVRLKRQGVSTVRVVRDGLPALLSVCLIPFRWHCGQYDRDALNKLREPTYWIG